jgi:hypothetical protein
MTVLYSIAVIALVVIYVIETTATVSRGIGIFLNSPAEFNHASMVMMLGNRIFVAFVMLSLGFFVDSGANSEILISIFLLFTIIYSLVIFLVLRLSRKIPFYLYRLCKIIHDIDLGKIKEFNSESGRIDMKSAIATFFFIAGISLPSIFATNFIEYRATLMQTGFIFNSIGSFINVMMVEKVLARSKDCSETEYLIKSILKGKILGVICVGALFALYLASNSEYYD